MQLKNSNKNKILTKEMSKTEDLDKRIKKIKDTTYRLKTDSSQFKSGRLYGTSV